MSRAHRPAPLTRFIYVIGPEQGLQKVGLATDPRSRLATLQTASPFDLLLHASVAVPFGHAHTIERQAHRLLVRSCVRNEWFETTPADAIAAVHAAAVPWIKKGAPLSAPANPPVPAEWRISRADRKPVTPPDLTPLMEFGRQIRPDAAFHKAPTPAALPLFDYQPPTAPSVAAGHPDRGPGGLSDRASLLRRRHHIPAQPIGPNAASGRPDVAGRGNRAVSVRAVPTTHSGGRTRGTK